MGYAQVPSITSGTLRIVDSTRLPLILRFCELLACTVPRVFWEASQAEATHHTPSWPIAFSMKVFLYLCALKTVILSRLASVLPIGTWEMQNRNAHKSR